MKNINRGINKEKKLWLSSYSELMEQVEEETRMAGYWQDKARSLSSPVLSLAPSKSADRKGMADYVVEFLQIAEYCSELANKANEKKKEILAAIDKIEDPNCRQVLRMYYLEKKNLRQIAEKMHYSIDWVKRLHIHALELIEIP